MTVNEYAHGPNPMRVHLAIVIDGKVVASCRRPGAWRYTTDPEHITCIVCMRNEVAHRAR